jgi:hypothetical protein
MGGAGSTGRPRAGAAPSARGSSGAERGRPRTSRPGGSADGDWESGARTPRPRTSAPTRSNRGADGSPRPAPRRDRGDAGTHSTHSTRRPTFQTRTSSRPAQPRTTGRDRVEASRVRVDEPRIPDGTDPRQLDPSVRRELLSLSKLNAEAVAAHLVAAGQLLDTDPRAALEHARAARQRAARVGVVREAVGIAAYHAQEWAEALTELRTARRITGNPRNLAVIADCERALGRPEAALRALTDPNFGRLDPETKAELFIVVAGARRDLGQLDAALGVLARGGLDRNQPRPGSVRVWYL